MDPLPDVAVGKVGAPGTVEGVALATVEADDWPFALTAVTTQKYWVPLVRLFTEAEVALDPLAVALGVPVVAGGLVVEQ
jgi:hypothetical protein